MYRKSSIGLSILVISIVLIGCSPKIPNPDIGFLDKNDRCLKIEDGNYILSSYSEDGYQTSNLSRYEYERLKKDTELCRKIIKQTIKEKNEIDRLGMKAEKLNQMADDLNDRVGRHLIKTMN